MHPLLIFRLVLIGLVTTACSSAAGEPSVTAAQSVASTIATPTTEAATTTEAPTTSTTAAADAAPPEMEGVWRTDLGNNDRVQLTLRGTDYGITRGGNSGSGDISIEGDLITFSGSNLCDGVGTYQWSVDGDSLTFTPTESGDPCSGRRPVLDGVTYTR